MAAGIAAQIKTIDILLKHGTDLNAKRASDGFTPLHLAVERATPEVIQALLERGADPLIRNAKRQTPLDLAQQLAKEYPASEQTLLIKGLLEHLPTPAK